MELDTTDRRIVAVLLEDGRLGATGIGRRLGLSEATVRRRRLRLLRNDVVRIVAVPNPFKLGFAVMAIIGIRIRKNKLAEIERALVEMPQVRFLGVTLGRYDLMLEAWFTSGEEFLRFVTDTLAKVEGVEQTESFHIMRLSKYTYDWGKEEADHYMIAGP